MATRCPLHVIVVGILDDTSVRAHEVLSDLQSLRSYPDNARGEISTFA